MNNSGNDINIPELARILSGCEICAMTANTSRGFQLSGRKAIYQVLDDLVAVLFPGCHGRSPIPEEQIRLSLIHI